MSAMARFEIPDEPVDGFTLEWFTVNGNRDRVDRLRAVYYANTKWSDYSDNGRGSDLVDQWMLCCNDNLLGRSDGWASPRDRWSVKDCYETQHAALEALRCELNQRADQMQSKVDDLRERIEELAAEAAATAATGPTGHAGEPGSAGRGALSAR